MVAVESRWKRSTFSFISMDMIRRAWIIRVHSEMTRTALRSFLPERFLSGRDRARIVFAGNREETEGTGGIRFIIFLAKHRLIPSRFYETKGTKGNRNITEAQRKRDRDYGGKDRKREERWIKNKSCRVLSLLTIRRNVAKGFWVDDCFVNRSCFVNASPVHLSLRRVKIFMVIRWFTICTSICQTYS